MQFISTTIKGIFETRISFEIPIYQRAYSWEEGNWTVFLEDVVEQSTRNNGYSYGNILLETIAKDSKYEIIDGQQRLTTLIIFMRALINVLDEKGHDMDDLEDMEEAYIVRKGTKKLRPIENDRAYFDAIIVENTTSKPASPSQKKMTECKEFFTKKFREMDIELLLKIKEVIATTQINRIELSGKKESALMFELQNNRGKSLTNLEKLKSYFMYQIYVNSPSEEADSNVETISDYFKEIYKTIYDIEGLSEDSILIYHCNAYLKTAFAYRNLDHLKEEFKAVENQKEKIDWIKNFTRELSESFKSLKTLKSCKSPYYKKLISMGRGAALPAFTYPFIIKGYKFFGNDTAKIDKLLHILEILSFRYYLIGSRAELNSRLSDIIREFDGDLLLLRDSLQAKLNAAGYWGDDKMKGTLSGWMYTNPVLHYLLWEYENSIQSKGYNAGEMKIENEQIEHISPQTPTTDVALASGYDVDANNCYSDEFVEKELNCIGNLMLISGSHNASIGNKPFAEKLSTYLNNPLCNQQKEIPSFITNGVAEWKTEHIEARKKKILDFAIPRWSFENVKVQ